MDVKLEEYVTAEEYYALPEGTHAELIDGVLYYPPYGQAAPARKHQGLLMKLSKEIDNYIEAHNGDCRVYPAPFDVQLNKEDDSVVQPDISVICDPKKLTDQGCLGAPDWVIEIVSPGNAGYDYITKLQKYHSSGVREYWIVDPTCDIIAVYNLSTDRLLPKSYTFQDIVPAGIYDDLSIDFKKITAAL
ncbi:MAG: Uma2 family endonuclease [Lachnospiraceae bacterium]|nr:Uma2 family endonuclease [Lachnospiraceae bacterium]